ncbi:MAG: ABC transporter ATP-binding protein [Bacteroidota bacterium]
MPVLKIENLTKRYGSLVAVNGLSLEVERGNIYGILGPNGSGKTTTLGMILGITHEDSGSYTWFEGQYGTNARRQIGALLETPNFYPYLTAEQNLEIVAHIKKVKEPKMQELLGLVNLAHRSQSLFRTYSFGMKQRLAIAAAMIGDPDVLIFDEPTNGLDPQGIAEVRETLQTIAARGKTIIMASHILDEVEKVCSHVAIIKNGNLLTTGPVGAIITNDISIEIAAENNEQLLDMLHKHLKINNVERGPQTFIIHIDEEVSTAAVNQLAFQNGFTLTHLAQRQKSLESEFLEITKDVN